MMLYNLIDKNILTIKDLKILFILNLYFELSWSKSFSNLFNYEQLKPPVLADELNIIKRFNGWYQLVKNWIVK